MAESVAPISAVGASRSRRAATPIALSRSALAFRKSAATLVGAKTGASSSAWSPARSSSSRASMSRQAVMSATSMLVVGAGVVCAEAARLGLALPFVEGYSTTALVGRIRA